jgi:CheY-like chemotaxis protein
MSCAKNPKVLVVEDNPSARTLVEQMLSKVVGGGFEILSARDGEEALVMLERHQPDLVILDLHMPKKSGTEVLAYLCASEHGDTFSHTLVAIASSDDDLATTLHKTNNPPVKWVLVKPVQIDKLSHMTKEFFAEFERQASA